MKQIYAEVRGVAILYCDNGVRSLENSDKQYLLVEVSGLASNAVAVALMAGKCPYEAIRLLEHGRGVILGSLSERRANISDLLNKRSQLAEEYIKLRDQVNAPTRLQSGEPEKELETTVVR